MPKTKLSLWNDNQKQKSPSTPKYPEKSHQNKENTENKPVSGRYNS